MATLQQLLDFFEYLFPSHFALPDDRTGLQIKGDRNQISRVLAALELNQEVFLKTLKHQIDFLYLHHPPIWNPLFTLTNDDPWCRMTTQLFHEGISVLAHHTNLDIYPGGIADQWITILQLQGKVKPLSPKTSTHFKIITYVPPDYLETVAQAIFQNGAGVIGQYRSCSFQIEGVGTFLPIEGAQPFIGKVGSIENVKEIRIEVTFSDSKLIKQLIDAIKTTHPYQNPVIDIYPLYPHNSVLEGLGRVITLNKPLKWNNLIQCLKPLLKKELSLLRWRNSDHQSLQKIALCPGSGGSLLEKVILEKPDVYISGDLNHHEIETLKLYSIEYIPVPHGDGERLGFKMLFNTLKKTALNNFPELMFLFEDELDL
ncbi:MAG: Nif3-like dinuclear metal center hexameric protein [Candidatus Atribacteria bacterium]|nr:Nif3-like dinuclear metal center hexameric protein [Candidatus Atribacteria bacterium]